MRDRDFCWRSQWPLSAAPGRRRRRAPPATRRSQPRRRRAGAAKEPRRRLRSPSSAQAEAHGVLGRDVRSPADEDMGRIVDVIVDRAGTVRAAVIDFGGFLGVGSRKIVVDWNALHFGRIANKSDSITLELTKEQVMAAPEYKEDTPSSCSAPPAACSRCNSITEIAGERSCSLAHPDIEEPDSMTDDARPVDRRRRFAPRAGTGGGDAAARAFAPEPARPRLVHFLSGGCADRVRAVHRGLSDDAEMDPGRDRLRAVDRRHGRPDRADAGRRDRRCRALRTAGGGSCGRDDRRQRAGICGVADLSGGGGRGHACMPRRVACSVRPLPRSASAWSDRSRSASGSDAMRAMRRSATASPPP